ncbi:unnamed protein product [Boreogadus saida]
MGTLSLLLLLCVTAADAQWWSLIFGGLDDTTTTSSPSSTPSSSLLPSDGPDPRPPGGTREGFTSRGTTGDLVASQRVVGSSPPQWPTAAPHPHRTTGPQSPGRTPVPERPNSSRTRAQHRPLKLWRSDGGAGRHLDLMALVGVPLPPGVSFARGFDSLPAFSFGPEASVGRLARTLLPGPFYPDFSIIATVRPSGPRGGVLFSILDSAQQGVELGLALGPAQQGLQSILLYHRPPRGPAHTHAAARFTVPELTEQWTRFTVAVEGAEVRLYMDCGEAELAVFHRGGAPLLFPHDAGIFVGNAGGTRLHKFVEEDREPVQAPPTEAPEAEPEQHPSQLTSTEANEVVERTGPYQSQGPGGRNQSSKVRRSMEKALKAGEESQAPRGPPVSPAPQAPILLLREECFWRPRLSQAPGDQQAPQALRDPVAEQGETGPREAREKLETQ